MSAQQSPATSPYTRPEPSPPAHCASDFVMDSCHAVENCVQRHPTAAVLTAFGAAFGVGLLIGHALGEPLRPPESYSQRWRRRIEDSLSSLPESISKRMHR